MAKQEPQVESVTMQDGRVVDFPGKRRILKESFEQDGNVVTRVDFANGQTVQFVVPTDLLLKFAAHGAEQKLGDAAAGIKDIDDAYEAVNELATRLGKGEWNAKRESNGMAGASVLVRALCEAYPSKAPSEIREWLSGKTHAEKMALRNSPKVQPIVARIEAEKANKSTIDADALLEDLG